MSQQTLRPWKTISRETILEHNKFLTIENHVIELPDGQIINDWAWIVAPDAVLVVAVTPEDKFLCFNQTKYAVDGTSLAPVGGHMEADETPLNAAKRELIEETGYTSENWIDLGRYRADSNRGIAMRYLFLAQDATLTAAPDNDDLEDQHLLLLSRDEIETALDNNEFKVVVWATVIALALRKLKNK